MPIRLTIAHSYKHRILLDFFSIFVPSVGDITLLQITTVGRDEQISMKQIKWLNNLKIDVIWDVTLCSFVDRYQSILRNLLPSSLEHVLQSVGSLNVGTHLPDYRASDTTLTIVESSNDTTVYVLLTLAVSGVWWIDWWVWTQLTITVICIKETKQINTNWQKLD